MASRRQQQTLLTALTRLILGLDDCAPFFQWEIFGKGNTGLFNILAFKSFDNFLKYLKDCGLVKMHKVHKTPSFQNRVLEEISNYRIRPENVSKVKMLRVGQGAKLNRIGAPCVNLRWGPIRDFWESATVKKWLQDNERNDRFPNIQGGHPPTSTPMALERKRRIRTPLSTNPPTHRVRIFSPPKRAPSLLSHAPSNTTTPTGEGSLEAPHDSPSRAMRQSRLLSPTIQRTPSRGKRLFVGNENLHEIARNLPPTPMEPANRQARTRAGPKLHKIKSQLGPSNIDIKIPTAHFIAYEDRNRVSAGLEYCTVEHGPNMHHFAVSKGYKVELQEHHFAKSKESVLTAIIIPSRKDLKDTTQQTLLEKKADLGIAVGNAMKAKRFDWPDYSRRLLGGLVAYHPKISSLAWEQVIPLVVGAFLRATGATPTSSALAKLSPCRQTTDDMLFDFATDSLLLFQDTVEHAGIYYISYDKADSNKGLGGCVKLFAAWDDRRKSEEFPDGRPVVSTVDADKTGDTSADVASGVAHACVKLENTQALAHGLTSDSGGGGNTESGGAALEKHDDILAENYLIANCTLHNLNLEASIPMKDILMGNSKVALKPGEEPRHVEQLLYSAYAWESEAGLACVKEFWASSAEYCSEKYHQSLEQEDEDSDPEYENVVLMFLELEGGEKYVRMSRGSETRWWTLGEAADVLLRTLPMRRFMAKNFDDSKLGKEESKTRQIAQTFLSLSKEPSLIADLAYMKCFHRFYIARHMKFFQSPDMLIGAAGFQAFSIFVRCFLMEEDYLVMMNGWDTLDEFQDLVERVKAIPPDATSGSLENPNLLQFQYKKIRRCLRHSFLEHKKMFSRWMDIKCLAFLAVFSEFPTGRIVAMHLLGVQSHHDYGDRIFNSPNHQRGIHLGRFAKFVGKCIPESLEVIQEQFHIIRNMDAIKEIAQGLNIWNRARERSDMFRQRCLLWYGCLFTNNQGTERANKDQNLANSNFRGEKNTSIRMMAMTYIKEMGETVAVLGEKRKKNRGREKIEDMMWRIENVHRGIVEMKARMRTDEYQSRRKKAQAVLRENFQNFRVKEAKKGFEEAFKFGHIESAKEKFSGIDIHPILEGKLPLGKIFQKYGDNYDLFQLELKGRMKEAEGRPLTAEEDRQIEAMKIENVKKAIQERDSKTEPANKYNKKYFKVRFTDIAKYVYQEV